MSKELEALSEVNNLIEYYGEESTTYDSWQVIIEALTPPTAEQLCEELEKYLNEPVWLDERNEIRISTQWLVRKIYYEGEYKGLNFLVVLPPRLIKRIAQFYESEVKE